MRTENKGLDPRTKLIAVILISSLGVFIENYIYLSLVLAASCLFGVLLKSGFFSTLKKLKRMLGVFFAMIVIQSLFIKSGEAVVSIGSFALLTDAGLFKGIEFILRISIILVSASILSTSSYREIVQGLVEMKIPFEIAFMVSVAIRFLPMLTEEVKDAFCAIQLRGIETEKLKLRQKLNLYSYIFTPVVVNTIIKAQKLSVVMECRGFRAYDRRTSYLKLNMRGLDYFVIFLCLIFTITVVGSYINFDILIRK